MTSARPDRTSEQRWTAESYAENVRFVSEYGSGVLEWLAPQAGERILDLGCGDGELTVKIIAAGAEVVGVDSSDNFVEAAREKGIDARLSDGQDLGFGDEFDAVFSNAALHWMRQPDNVIAGVARALKPGGRFVAEFGGFGNVATYCAAIRAVGQARNVNVDEPWYFPTESEYSQRLEAAGFEVDRIVLFARPTLLPTGARGWLEVMRAPFFDRFGDDREAALSDVIAAVEPSMRDSDGRWYADYVRLRFAARLAA